MDTKHNKIKNKSLWIFVFLLLVSTISVNALNITSPANNSNVTYNLNIYWNSTDVPVKNYTIYLNNTFVNKVFNNYSTSLGGGTLLYSTVMTLMGNTTIDKYLAPTFTGFMASTCSGSSGTQAYYVLGYTDGTTYNTGTQTDCGVDCWRTWTNGFPSKKVKYVEIYYRSLVGGRCGYAYGIGEVYDNNATYTTNIYTPSNYVTSSGSYPLTIKEFDPTGAESNNTTIYLNLDYGGLLNITAFNYSTPIANFTVHITDNNTSTTNTYNTSTGSILLYLTIGDNYNVLLNATNFAYDSRNVTLLSPLVFNMTFGLVPSNSINITLYNEYNNSLLNSATSTVVFSGSGIQYTYTTSNGTLFVSGLLADTYVVTASYSNYTTRSYTITVADRSTQVLNIYLAQATQTTVFTYLDSSTGSPLSNVTAIMYGFVNGTLQPISSQISDPTGRIQWTFLTNRPYQFYSSKEGYNNKLFELSPSILFTAYNVPMARSGSVLTPNDVNVYYSPKIIDTTQSQNLTIYFQSPNGLLTLYSFTLTSTCYSTSGAGNDANGQGFIIPINISGCLDANMFLTTTYYTSTGANVTQSVNIPIRGTYGNYTIMSNSQQTFGMGIFERTLIVVMITLIVGGVASLLGGLLVGALVGLFILAYFSAITGFINPSATFLVLVVGVILLISKSVNN